MNNKLKTEACWISPDGQILFMGESTHIAVVIKNPKAFKYTMSEIQSLYNDYDEALGVEGKAREIIIKDLIKSGWLRSRKYKKPYRWTLNTYTLSERSCFIISHWATLLINNFYSLIDEVMIDTPNKRFVVTLDSLSKGAIFENKIMPEAELRCKVISSVYDFKFS